MQIWAATTGHSGLKKKTKGQEVEREMSQGFLVAIGGGGKGVFMIYIPHKHLCNFQAINKNIMLKKSKQAGQ